MSKIIPENKDYFITTWSIRHGKLGQRILGTSVSSTVKSI